MDGTTLPEHKIHANLQRFSGKRLTFMPELDSFGGYGLHATQYVKHWSGLGVHVSVRPTRIYESDTAKISMDVKRKYVHCDQLEDWEVVLSPANFMPMQRKKTAYFTMYESSLWSPKMVRLVNRAAAVIVPCEWNRFGLQESGCIVPVHVVPLGYSEESFKPTPMNMDGPCVFGAAGRMSHGVIRKGLNVVIDAFLKEFKTETDVQLHVKGFQDCPTRYIFDKRVVVRDAFLKEDKLAEWYSGLTCFVSAARGEAWGLMQLEAMASARPVIVAIYGGVKEFANPSSCYPVDFVESKSEEAWCNGGNWAVPDEKHIRHLMRGVYKDRAAAKRIGELAAETTKQFTWRNSAIQCLGTLEELGAI